MSSRLLLIFSGFNQRAVISFLRTLKKANAPFVIVAKSQDDTIFKTEYKKKVICTRQSIPLKIEDLLNCIKQIIAIYPHKELIIAPSTEALNRFLLKHKEIFAELKCLIPLPGEPLYELISDKYSFGGLCIKNKIEVPRIYESLSEARMPFVAKPFKYFSRGDKIYSPVLILNKNDKNEFLRRYAQDEFFYQEFVSGKSLYLLYYFHRNGTIFKYSQENIVQQPDGKSIIAAKSSNFHLSLESVKYEQLLKKINYYGMIMIEVRQYKSKNYMIEANPRFWGPSQLFVDAEKNFFEAFLHDYGVLPEAIDFYKNKNQVNYFWFGGLLESYKNGKKPVFHEGNEEKFLLELHKWLKCDIYNRKDTIEIFSTEME